MLITRAGLPPLIVTLATFSLFRGLAEEITRGVDTFTGFPDSFLQLGQGQWIGLPSQLPVFVVIGLTLTNQPDGCLFNLPNEAVNPASLPTGLRLWTWSPT
jgi:predicted ABC-type sugar transport system permease subunit